MVFETLIEPINAEKHSWRLIFLGMAYVSLAMMIAYWIFKDYASMVMIFLTVLASANIMHGIINFEEEQDEESYDEKTLLSQHWNALLAFMFLFLGFTLAYTFWYVTLSFSVISPLFQAQNATVARITGGHIAGFATQLSTFNIIFSNNIKVLVVSLIFSFFYGYGAIFILSWNASVIAAAAGSSFRQWMATHSAWYAIYAFPASLAQYALHGSVEMAAFFVAALAGGIIGSAIAKKKWLDADKFKKVIVDFLDLTILSVLLLFMAAIIEVWITPLIMIH